MAGVTGEQDWYVSGVFAMSFINLNDTIGDYVGRANNLLKVNAAEDGVTVVEGTFEDHSARHENGGADEISVAGLSGLLADDQNPKDHASTHEPGGSDELSFAGTKINGVVRLTNPKGAADIWDTLSETGAIQIILPAVVADMIYLHATVYDYIDRASFDVIVFGYLDTDTPQWLRATAVIIGDNPNTKRVRFCRNADSSAWYVVIGDTDTSWGYPWIAITDFKAGHTPAIADWDDGWSMSLITSIPSYTDFDYTDARVSPEDHSSRHANGGEDELNVGGLSGELVDDQPPKAHHTSHESGGADEIAISAAMLSDYQVGSYRETERSNEKITTSSSWTKFFEARIPRAGTLRFRWQMKIGYATITAYSCVYRNGSAVGSAHSTTSDSYGQISEDISGWSAGDLVQLYARNSDNNTEAFIRFFCVCCNNSLIVSPTDGWW